MKEEIKRIVENGRLLAAFAENHPLSTEIALYCHAESVPTMVFLARHLPALVADIGAQDWKPRDSHRGANDIFRFLDGVMLIVRDAEVPAMVPGLNHSPCHS